MDTTRSATRRRAKRFIRSRVMFTPALIWEGRLVDSLASRHSIHDGADPLSDLLPLVGRRGKLALYGSRPADRRKDRLAQVARELRAGREVEEEGRGGGASGQIGGRTGGTNFSAGRVASARYTGRLPRRSSSVHVPLASASALVRLMRADRDACHARPGRHTFWISASRTAPRSATPKAAPRTPYGVRSAARRGKSVSVASVSKRHPRMQKDCGFVAGIYGEARGSARCAPADSSSSGAIRRGGGERDSRPSRRDAPRLTQHPTRTRAASSCAGPSIGRGRARRSGAGQARRGGAGGGQRRGRPNAPQSRTQPTAGPARHSPPRPCAPPPARHPAPWSVAHASARAYRDRLLLHLLLALEERPVVRDGRTHRHVKWHDVCTAKLGEAKVSPRARGAPLHLVAGGGAAASGCSTLLCARIACPLLKNHTSWRPPWALEEGVGAKELGVPLAVRVELGLLRLPPVSHASCTRTTEFQKCVHVQLADSPNWSTTWAAISDPRQTANQRRFRRKGLRVFISGSYVAGGCSEGGDAVGCGAAQHTTAGHCSVPPASGASVGRAVQQDHRAGCRRGDQRLRLQLAVRGRNGGAGYTE